MSKASAMGPEPHVLAELGLAIDVIGDELHGTAAVHPEMCVPGTTCLRISVLAAWADHVAGLVAAQAVAPRVGVTLDLDVHLSREPSGLHAVRAIARLLKVGRAVAVVGIELITGDGDPVGVAAGSFMPAPDARLTLPPLADSLADARARTTRLTMPFAERARCERLKPGVALIPVSAEASNASKTLNGGLLALVVEEAHLSAASGSTLASLAMRYLRPVRVGPAVAHAEVRFGLARVEVRDGGSDDRLAVTATTRAFDR
jgi:acyl-coenzyme A thioesterase PaaI-like protein